MTSKKEISDYRGSEITETIIDPVRTQNRYWEIANLAKVELLALFSTANAFARQEKAGSPEIVKNLTLQRKGLKVRLLTPECKTTCTNKSYNFWYNEVFETFFRRSVLIN
jgi:hypothetical protein